MADEDESLKPTWEGEFVNGLPHGKVSGVEVLSLSLSLALALALALFRLRASYLCLRFESECTHTHTHTHTERERCKRSNSSRPMLRVKEESFLFALGTSIYLAWAE